MSEDLIKVIEQVAFEKGLPADEVFEVVKEAIKAAYKKDYGSEDQDVRVEIDKQTGNFRVFVKKTVVSVPENPYLEIPIILARSLKKDIKLGDIIEVEENTLAGYGRIASQHARQAMVQKLYEIERKLVATNYQSKVGELVSGVVYEVEKKGVILTLEKAQAILPYSGQIPGEKYYPGQRLKCLLEKVDLSATGSGEQIVLTRSSTKFIEKLFEESVPELEEGNVKIERIVREPGKRTKLAVRSLQEGIDAVGTFVGPRGIRVRTVTEEINNEKLDLIPWSEDPEVFIRNSLAPARVLKIEFLHGKEVNVLVPEDQLALAIGKGGQNVRLASLLTGFNLNVRSNNLQEDNRFDKLNIEVSNTKIVLIHSDSSGPSDHWFPDLEEKLVELGLEVENRQFPEPEIAPKNVWLKFLFEEIGVDENTIIVGHSTGAICAMMAAEERKLRGIILVAPHYTDLGGKLGEESHWFDNKWRWDEIKKNCEFIIQYSSKDDPLISIDESIFVAEKLNSELKLFDNKGHFTASDGVLQFPEIVDDIKKKLGMSNRS